MNKKLFQNLLLLFLIIVICTLLSRFFFHSESIAEYVERNQAESQLHKE